MAVIAALLFRFLGLEPVQQFGRLLPLVPRFALLLRRRHSSSGAVGDDVGTIIPYLVRRFES